MPARPQPLGPRRQRTAGWSLLELLLALSLGLGLCGVMLQALVQDTTLGARLVRLVRERTNQRRSLALIRGDLGRAQQVWLSPGAALLSSPCSLGNRQVVLQLTTHEGRISYSVGPPPSPIWRGWVLLRCGPAFGLAGEPSGGAFQNRVLLDGLGAEGLRASLIGPGLVSLDLSQQFSDGGQVQTIRSTMVVAAPGLLGNS